MDMPLQIFNEIGNAGDIIIIFLSFYLLWHKNTLFFYYTIGIFINTMLNLIMKCVFKQPRPSEDPNLFNLALTRGKHILYKDRMPYDIFGMPSGHSQTALFSTIFIYLSLKKQNVLYVYIFLSLIVTAQRIAYNHHTIIQVIAGAIFGSCFGYFIYSLAQLKIKGLNTEKLDNYCLGVMA